MIRANPKSRAWITQLAKPRTEPSLTRAAPWHLWCKHRQHGDKSGHGSSALKLGRAGKTTGTTKTAGKTTGTTTAASHAKTKVAQVHYGVGVLNGRSAKAKHS